MEPRKIVVRRVMTQGSAVYRIEVYRGDRGRQVLTLSQAEAEELWNTLRITLLKVWPE